MDEIRELIREIRKGTERANKNMVETKRLIGEIHRVADTLDTVMDMQTKMTESQERLMRRIDMLEWAMMDGDFETFDDCVHPVRYDMN